MYDSSQIFITPIEYTNYNFNLYAVKRMEDQKTQTYYS